MLSRNLSAQLQSVPTPFYLYDMDLLRRTLHAARSEADRYGYRLHYALKANFEERIVAAVRDAGYGVDCVSGNEVRMAVRMGFDPQGIVYAGVGKTDAELRYALLQGILAFNCESIEELDVLDALAAERGVKARVALRINPDVDPHTHRNISTGQASSKFGISYREIEPLAARLDRLPWLSIVGLHFHIGSQIRSMEVFAALCRRVNPLVRWFRERGFGLEFVNVGGGLGIDYDDPDREPVPDFASYFGTFHRELDAEGLTVHFELGRSLVGQAGELVTEVLYTKQNPTGQRVIIVDASMTDLVRPALYHARHRIVPLTEREGPEQRCMVAGTVCESSDIFDEAAPLRNPQRGDRLAIESTGAYGQAMASRYNLHDPAGVVYSDALSAPVK